MSITIVAQRAGVSSSTVSRVINNHPRVAPETIRIVRRVMAELGYVPSDRRPGPKPHQRNQAAATHVAFVKFSNRQVAAPGFETLLRGVSDSARRHNLALTIHDLPSADEFPRKIFDIPMAGMLVHGAMPTPEVRKALTNVPTVWLMGNSTRPDWGDQVMPDVFEIGRIAAKYLVDRGHTRLAFLNLEKSHWPFRLAWQAFATTADDLGASAIRVHPPIERKPGAPYDRTAVDALAQAFNSLSPEATGVFIADDFQAAMVQPVLQEHGVRIGNGIDVISCNNEDAYLMALHPRPASIDIRLESIGRRAIDQLLWRANHPTFDDRIVTTIEPRLVAPEEKRLPISEPAGETLVAATT
jgi:LacI family transcriptional regulator